MLVKYESDLAPPEEPSAARIAVSIVIVIAVIAFLAWCAASMQAMAAEVCAPETQEARITDAIAEFKPTVWVFEGAGLNTFMQSLNEWGLMAGRPVNADKVYVTLYEGHYTLFFLYRGCIVAAYHAPGTVMERLLPQ
jgi:hypothetical protein